MGPIIWLPNGTIKVRPSHSLSHFHIASNQNHFNCAYHLIVFNIFNAINKTEIRIIFFFKQLNRNIFIMFLKLQS